MREDADEYHIVAIVADEGYAETQVLQIAASVLYFSDFPIVPSLLARARREEVAQLSADKFERIPEVGARAILSGAAFLSAGIRAAVGSREILALSGGVLSPALRERARAASAAGYSLLFVVYGDKVLGFLSLRQSSTPAKVAKVDAEDRVTIRSRAIAIVGWGVVVSLLVLYFLYR